MNLTEDDGQLAPQTVTNLTRMAANLTGPARVSISNCISYRNYSV